MAEAKSRALKALHDLVTSCHDATEAYSKAAKGIHDSGLRSQLAEISNERERFAVDLMSTIRELGDEARTDHHEGEILNRGWAELVNALRFNADAEILQGCINGDLGTIKHYDHALAEELPDEARLQVESQKLRVEQDIAYLRARTPKRMGQRA